MKYDSSTFFGNSLSRDSYELPLSEADFDALHSLGLRYYLTLNSREEELLLEIRSSEGCVYEEGFSCRSFAGWHDEDAWNSAVAKAHQALKDWIAGVFDNQVEMGV